MDVRACKRCKKLFQFQRNPLCPACVHELDELFNDVRNFIYENPSATLETICEKTGVDPNMVQHWLREGRLILQKGNAALLTCTKCGTPIQSGKLCDACQSNLQDQLAGAAASFKPKEAEKNPVRGKNKMHVKR